MLFCLSSIFAFAQIPINDSCADAFILTANTSIQYDTFRIGSATSDITGCSADDDVWFKFEMPASDDAFISMTQVSNNSTPFRITAYSGTCNSLVEEDCSSSGNYPDLSLRNLGLAGDTVYLQVYRRNNVIEGDTFGLCVKDTVLPPLRVEAGDYEKVTDCQVLSGSGWYDLTDTLDNLIMSIDPNGGYMGRTCFGIHIEDSTASPRTAPDTLGNTAQVAPRNYFIDPVTYGFGAIVRLYFKERELKIWRDSLSAQGLAVGPSLAAFYTDSLRISKTDGENLSSFLGDNQIQINPTVTKVRDSIIMAEFSVTSFSNFIPVFNPGNISTPVPVEWLSFNGRKLNSTVNLNWATASELNCSHFEVQRSSDGKNFRTIGIVEGNGTTNSISNYNFADANLTNYKLYYRLKQIDFNGTFDFSEIVVIKPENKISVWPNPFTDVIEVSVGKEEILAVTITDLFGREVYNKEVFETNIQLKLNDIIDHGVYMLRIETEAEILEEKIIKY